MFLTLLLYFWTSILTLLNFVKYCSFRAVTKYMKRGLGILGLIIPEYSHYTSILLYFYTHATLVHNVLLFFKFKQMYEEKT